MADCNQQAQAARSAQEMAAFAHAFHRDPGAAMGAGGMEEEAAAMMEAEAMMHQMNMGGDGGAQDWANQFHAHMAMQGVAPQAAQAEGWHAEYEKMMAEQEHLEAVAWAEAEMSAKMDEEAAAATAAADEGTWADQFHAEEGEEWAKDFNNDDTKVMGVEGEPIVSVEQKTKDSKFYDMMAKIKQGELTIEESAEAKAKAAKLALGDLEDMDDAWATAAKEALAEQEGLTTTNDDDDEAGVIELKKAWADVEDGDTMADEFITQMKAAEAEAGNAVLPRESDWATEFGEDWAGEMNHEEFADGEEWLKEYQEMQKKWTKASESTDYPFEENNPFLFHENPFEAGQELLAAGTLSEAVLAFEAVCQKEPERVEGWQFLGTSQAENEKDRHAIKALNKAKCLCPKNQHVLLALASSHTNEANTAQALQSLKAWLLASDKYAALEQSQRRGVDAQPPAEDSDEAFAKQYFTPSEHKDVCALFEGAAAIDPKDVDVQIGLGVLHHIGHEFDEAATHFRHAVQLRPDDPKLWNKLGATLANGSKCEQAIEAYERALDINPGFVRVHYNMGIAFSNLGKHTLAAKQFVRAIHLQQGDGGPGNSHRSTQEMWDVLRMNLNLMERSDLVQKSWKQELGPFLEEFGLGHLKN